MRLLRSTLRANGLFSLLAGMTAVVFAETLASEMAVSTSVLYVVGIGVGLFGVSILVFSLRQEIDLRLASLIAVADVIWVIGAIVILAIPGSMSSKWILGLVSIPVAVFAVLQLRGIARATHEQSWEISATEQIAATPDQVWAPLVDIEGYSAWNPFMVRGSGVIAKGEVLEISMGSMNFKPTVTEAREGESFEWLGQVLAPGVFDGRHRFDLETTASGTTVTQSERFTGVLTPWLWKSLSSKTQADFESMNRSLKALVEGS